jgi:phytoene synthase
MCALYSFLRIADDISDEPAPADEKRLRLGQWRDAVQRAMTGDYIHVIYPALHDAVQRYGIPSSYLEAALQGVEMDLEPKNYLTFADLRSYCYRVASVVGLACIHIWGFHGARAEEYAISAGIAFQLTNILRDLDEDAEMGRLYLPREALHDAGITGVEPRSVLSSPTIDRACAPLVVRAKDHFARSDAIMAASPRRAVRTPRVMAAAYRSMLDAMIARGWRAPRTPVRLRKSQLIWIVLRHAII